MNPSLKRSLVFSKFSLFWWIFAIFSLKFCIWFWKFSIFREFFFLIIFFFLRNFSISFREIFASLFAKFLQYLFVKFFAKQIKAKFARKAKIFAFLASKQKRKLNEMVAKLWNFLRNDFSFSLETLVRRLWFFTCRLSQICVLYAHCTHDVFNHDFIPLMEKLLERILVADRHNWLFCTWRGGK